MIWAVFNLVLAAINFTGAYFTHKPFQVFAGVFCLICAVVLFIGSKKR